MPPPLAIDISWGSFFSLLKWRSLQLSKFLPCSSPLLIFFQGVQSSKQMAHVFMLFLWLLGPQFYFLGIIPISIFSKSKVGMVQSALSNNPPAHARTQLSQGTKARNQNGTHRSLEPGFEHREGPCSLLQHRIASLERYPQFPSASTNVFTLQERTKFSSALTGSLALSEN